MRECSRRGCGEPAEATVGLRYEPREVVVVDLTGERDPNLIELCGSHAGSLSAPLGWRLVDQRAGSLSAALE